MRAARICPAAHGFPVTPELCGPLFRALQDFRDFRDFFDKFFGEMPKSYKARSLGSGFIIDPKGYVVTNNHVVEGADKIKIILVGGKEYQATVRLGFATATDDDTASAVGVSGCELPHAASARMENAVRMNFIRGV